MSEMCALEATAEVVVYVKLQPVKVADRRTVVHEDAAGERGILEPSAFQLLRDRLLRPVSPDVLHLRDRDRKVAGCVSADSGGNGRFHEALFNGLKVIAEGEDGGDQGVHFVEAKEVDELGMVVQGTDDRYEARARSVFCILHERGDDVFVRLWSQIDSVPFPSDSQPIVPPFEREQQR